MTVKTEHGDFECRELTFKERRSLHRLEINILHKDGSVNLDKYYDVMEWIMRFAFEDAEKALGHLDDNQIDTVLSEIYSRYKNPSKKKN